MAGSSDIHDSDSNGIQRVEPPCLIELVKSLDAEDPIPYDSLLSSLRADAEQGVFIFPATYIKCLIKVGMLDAEREPPEEFKSQLTQLATEIIVKCATRANSRDLGLDEKRGMFSLVDAWCGFCKEMNGGNLTPGALVALRSIAPIRVTIELLLKVVPEDVDAIKAHGQTLH